MSINSKIIIDTSTYLGVNKTKFDSLPISSLDNNINSDQWEEYLLLKDSDEIDFGQLRGGYDDLRYKTQIANLIQAITDNSDQQKQIAKIFQIWGIKLNIHGVRIRNDNFITIGNKKFTAKDLAEMIGYAKDNILGFTLTEASWEKLTVFRFMRAYIPDAVKYLRIHLTVKPSIMSQITIDYLPREFHFINAIYEPDAKSYSELLIKLNREFDMIMDSVVKRVVSYEQRAVVFLNGLQNLESAVIDRHNKVENVYKVLIENVAKRYSINSSLDIPIVCYEESSANYKLYSTYAKSRRNLSFGQSTLIMYNQMKIFNIEELSKHVTKLVRKAIGLAKVKIEKKED